MNDLVARVKPGFGVCAGPIPGFTRATKACPVGWAKQSVPTGFTAVHVGTRRLAHPTTGADQTACGDAMSILNKATVCVSS